MGNRAVITTEENFNNNGIGIYLHWNGGRDSINGFLEYCKRHGYREPDKNCYGWAYLCGAITNFFGDGMCVGIDVVNNLDCDNFDNGVYLIKGWEVVGRKFFEGEEQNEYDLEEFVKEVDKAMPDSMKLYREETEKKEN